MNTHAMPPQLSQPGSDPLTEQQHWAAIAFAVGLAALMQGMWWGVFVVGVLSVVCALRALGKGRDPEQVPGQSESATTGPSVVNRLYERRETVTR